jgi:predicted transcriptional regulator
MKYRSRTDISREILQAASNGTSKTKIMYAAYLSFAQLKEYLAALSESGLLEYDAERTEYRTTPKGKQFLQVYDNMAMLTGELREIR